MVDPEKLRNAGTDYPVHILHRYTQLPPDLPGRIGGLAHEITVSAENPYEKAVLVERNLQRLEYNLEIDPPPFDVDGVDHFLFNQKQGYSEYFASAMAVLLRTVGVPTRLAVGYTSGEETEVPGIYAVRDSNSHGWVEVYFPGYSWVPFEPTPGQALPAIMMPASGDSLESEGEFFAEFDVDCIDDFVDECLEYVEPFLGSESDAAGPIAQGGTPGWVWALVILAGVTATTGAAWWAFRRYMFASYEPEDVYGRVQALASVGGLGGATPRTPYQFGDRLKSLLPLHRERLDLIVETYVRARYGGRRLSSEQARELADALAEPALSAAVGIHWKSNISEVRGVSDYRYHIQELPTGWIGLVGSEKGLRRAALKPTPQEVMEDLGSKADEAEHDAEFFSETLACLERYSDGDLTALDDIELDLADAPPFFSRRVERVPHHPSRRNAQLSLAGRRGGKPAGRPRRRSSHGAQPFRPHHPLPPRHIQRRRPGRLRWWGPGRQGQTLADGAGAGPEISDRSESRWARHKR